MSEVLSKPQTAPRPRVALALGSGGARGLAHIGVIDALQQAGLEIIAVAGSSMGAVIGGIYALGKLPTYRDWVCSLDRVDVLRLLDWTLTGPGFIKGDRIIKSLRALLGEADIESLRIPFTAVAVDIDRQREVWLARGRLFNAIRASIAIPTLFHPFEEEDGRRLVDGGLLNPVPVTPLLRERYDYLMAVTLDGPGEVNLQEFAKPSHKEKSSKHKRRLPARVHHLFTEWYPGNEHHDVQNQLGRFGLSVAAMELMQANLARLKLAVHRPDLVIEIPLSSCSSYEFYRATELIALGHAITKRALREANIGSAVV